MPRSILLTAVPQLALALAFVLPSELPRKSAPTATEAFSRPLALAAMFSDDLRQLSPQPRMLGPELPSVATVRLKA